MILPLAPFNMHPLPPPGVAPQNDRVGIGELLLIRVRHFLNRWVLAHERTAR